MLRKRPFGSNVRRRRYTFRVYATPQSLYQYDTKRTKGLSGHHGLRRCGKGKQLISIESHTVQNEIYHIKVYFSTPCSLLRSSKFILFCTVQKQLIFFTPSKSFVWPKSKPQLRSVTPIQCEKSILYFFSVLQSVQFHSQNLVGCIIPGNNGFSKELALLVLQTKAINCPEKYIPLGPE